MRAEVEKNSMEQQQINELVQELCKLRNLAENTNDMNGEYACEEMDESINEAVIECLQDMDSYERLEVLKNALGTHTLGELIKSFKETCAKYNIKENDNE